MTSGAAWWRILVILLMITGSTRTDAEPDRHDVVVIPAECADYWAIPGGASSPAAWNQLLSFAACVQDTSIEEVDDPSQLPELVEQMTRQLADVMPLYLAALERGPAPIRVRAAYQIGAAHVSLLVRARASIVAAPDLFISAQAAARYRELHVRLEPLLERTARIALASFIAVERLAASDRWLARNAGLVPVVRSAHQLAELLRRDWPEPPTRERGPAFPPDLAGWPR